MTAKRVKILIMVVYSIAIAINIYEGIKTGDIVSFGVVVFITAMGVYLWKTMAQAEESERTHKKLRRESQDFVSKLKAQTDELERRRKLRQRLNEEGKREAEIDQLAEHDE